MIMAVLHLSKSPVVIVVAQASLQECAAGQASARGSLVDSPEAIALGARHLYWLPLHYGPYRVKGMERRQLRRLHFRWLS